MTVEERTGKLRLAFAWFAAVFAAVYVGGAVADRLEGDVRRLRAAPPCAEYLAKAVALAGKYGDNGREFPRGDPGWYAAPQSTARSAQATAWATIALASGCGR